MAEGSDIDVRPDSMEGLAHALYLGMLALDGLAVTSPTLPDAGSSTPLFGRAMQAVAHGMAGLTEGFGIAGERVEMTVGTITETESTNTTALSVNME